MARPDKRGAEAEDYRRLYKTKEWRSTRAVHLQREPLCRMCKARGVINDGSRRSDGSLQPNLKRRFLVADHIKEHKGNRRLFFDPSNLQTLCPDDHDAVKQADERRGYSVQTGQDGWPTDPRHPANA